MQALILAAGMGKRLKDITSDKTKCMVEVNGITLIERMLRQLEQLNLERIVIVVGYQKENLKNFIASLEVRTPVAFVDNDIYDRTNNIYSLALAKEYLMEKDTILLESDLIFEDDVLQMLLEDPRDNLALVDKYESWMDGTVVKLSPEDEIVSFVPGGKFVFEDIPQYYKTVNIYKFSKSFSKNQYIPFLESYLKALGNNEYYEQVLRVLTLLDNSWLRAKRIEGKKWYEIDDIQDLDIACSIFTEPEDRLKKLQGRYGGYWRYPKLLDFCYLVNPYFPPKRLLDEIQSNANKLIMNYPSGSRVNSLLAAKNFSVRTEQIVVGNGAAELIKSLMENQRGSIGFIRPTFEEYPNRRTGGKDIVFEPVGKDFSYKAEDLMDFFCDREISMLVLINPDNPTGNYIEKQDMLRLARWCREKDITLLLDESFVDFADGEDNSLLQEDILLQYDNLVVVKSISKSYGVPGLRLGILASGDEELVRRIRNNISIWNINSLAEFYMQIEEKYKKDYQEALVRFRRTREVFVRALREIPGLHVFPSQANYVMCELSGRRKARDIATELLSDYNILLKDLSDKIRRADRQFIRIAVRTDEENEYLIHALKKLDLQGDAP